jgi:hypothetical protein
MAVSTPAAAHAIVFVFISCSCDLAAGVTRGHLVATSTDGVTVRTSRGEQSAVRSAIRKVTVPDPGRRILFGMLGFAGGAAAGFLVCPSCSNEGSSGAATSVGLGAAAGTAAFLHGPSRTIYEAPAP